jgi:hypothetical protein
MYNIIQIYTSNVPVCMKVNVFVKESGSDFSSHIKME